MVFCSLAKTSRKPKKTKKQKVQTHGQGLGRGLAGDMGLNFVFFFFCFFWFFHGFLQFGQNLEKAKKTKKTKSSDPWARSGERPGWGHGSELFVFFGFSIVFCSLAKTSRKPKKQKNQKVQTHGQGLGRGLAGDMGLNFLFFSVFPLFFAVWPKPRENKKKNQKVQTHGQGLGRGLAGDMGLIFFFMFFFACFSCEDAFITVPLKKCAFLQFAHLRPP